MVKLYGFPPSTCTRLVALVCKEKNIPYELIAVNLAKGEQKNPSFTAVQPFGQVPYIDDDGFILYESRAIARYLSKKYPDQGTSLIPSDPKAEALFEQADTGHVPVVVVFTKFEALRPVAYGEIKKQVKELSAEERSRRIAQRVEELFTNTGVLDRLSDPNNRAHPKSHVRLQNMNQPNANCNTLLESTTFALDDEELRLCLVSTQQSNLELCIKCAVATLVDQANRSLGPLRIDSEDYQYNIARWFPHLDVRSKREFRRSERHEVPDFNNNLFNSATTWKEDIIRVLQPLAAKGSLFTAANRLIHTGIATVIVLEYSAFLLDSSKNLERVESAVDYYLKSPTAVAVEEGAKDISRQGYKKEELERTILEFILENRMSRDLTAKK